MISRWQASPCLESISCGQLASPTVEDELEISRRDWAGGEDQGKRNRRIGALEWSDDDRSPPGLVQNELKVLVRGGGGFAVGCRSRPKGVHWLILVRSSCRC